MNYQEVVDSIINIPRFSNAPGEPNKSGKENLLKVMDELGNPHLKIKSIHIAGTNGKGSTARFVMDILVAKGLTVGIFTSPHLVKINERIAISRLEGNNRIRTYDISDEEFVQCFKDVQAAVCKVQKQGGLHLSFFEFMFAMAAVYFGNKSLDYVVYETGLGGRLDATNILMPEITAITSIGLDHTDYLGDNIEAVAKEKAGIIKAGVHVVYNTGEKKADNVIKARAIYLGSEEINVAKTDYIINEFTYKTIDFSMHNSYYNYHNLKLSAGGATYQVENAITAIILCNKLFEAEGYIDKDIIDIGLSNFIWPGRMEMIHPNIILDGAHNIDAISRFIQSVNTAYEGRCIHLLFAVAGDKEYGPMIDMLCEELSIDRVYVTSINSSRGISSEYISNIFKVSLEKKGVDNPFIFSSDHIKTVFTQAYNSVKDTDDILFCVGSLYLIGSIKEIAQEVLV